MQNRRRRRGFEHAGTLPLDRLGLPRGRARELILAQAWEEVAGSKLVRHARALRVQRGVLEIEISGGRWTDTLNELLPGLTGRLARRYPELGVHKFCWIVRDSKERGPILALETSRETEAVEAAQEAPALPKHEIEIDDRRDPSERLQELARRYVERGGDQNQ
jgi:hypothetical protein